MHRTMSDSKLPSRSCTEPRPGALRYLHDGEWVTANPGSVYFSSVTMLATQFYKECEGWVNIYEDGEGNAE